MTSKRTATFAALCSCLSLLFAQTTWAQDTAEDQDSDPAQRTQLRWYEGNPHRDHILDMEIPLHFSGYFWVDSGFVNRLNANESNPDQQAAYMQGRFVLATEYLREYDNGLYARARAEVINFVNEYTKSSFEAHVLDAFMEIGQGYWDVQVGRFLAWEVYDRGQGIELFTPEETGALSGPSLYWLDVARGYKNEAGQAAIHLYPFDGLGIEVAGVYGQESSQNVFGLRPVLDYRLGGLQLKAGYEFYAQRPQTDSDKVESTTHGFAAKLQYTLGIFRLALNASARDVDYTDIQGLVDGEKTFTDNTFGGFVDVDVASGSLGLGYHLTRLKNRQGERNRHHRLFASYKVFLPIEGVSVKAVYGFARAIIQDIDTEIEYDNFAHSVRLRLAYDFQ